jgi:uncharacterized protein YqeY
MLSDRIQKDYIDALKAKNKHKVDFLSFIRAEIKNSAIDLRKEKLDDNEVLTVIKKQKKRLQDSKESFTSSGRTDLIESLEKELNILDEYLPKPLEDSELTQIIEAIIAETNASSMKDMGKVMKEVLAKVGVRADSKKVSEIVKGKLSG